MNIAQILPSLGGLGFLLVLSGFFSGSETALCALTHSQLARLRSDSGMSSRSIVRFVDDPRRLFITILLGNTFVNISFATLTATLIYGLLGAGPSGIAVAVATVTITLALLVFGEITPKTFAIRHAVRFAAVTAPILWGFSILIFPLRWVLRVLTDVLVPVFGGVPSEATDNRITSDHLKAVIQGDGGVMGPHEREIIERILDLRQINASEIMVPRTAIVAMQSSATIRQVLKRAREVGFSRVPIYGENIDDILGVFRVKDWLTWRDQGVTDLPITEFLAARESMPMRGNRAVLVHPPFFTPETRRVSDLFRDLALRKTKVAFLLDEFGGVSGSLTLEDIVEEVVGEIVDEHDARLPTADIVQRPDDPTTFDVAGQISVHRVNRRLKLNLDEDLADTVGGYVLALFGHIPGVGESHVDNEGVRFEVARIEGRRVAAVVMTVPERPQ